MSTVSDLRNKNEQLLNMSIENGLCFIREHFSEQICLVQLAKEENILESERLYDSQIENLEKSNEQLVKLEKTKKEK